MTENTIVNFTDTATGWQRAFDAFLAEKEQRSGSHRTVEGYSRMLQDFFGRSGKQPDNVTSQDILFMPTVRGYRVRWLIVSLLLEIQLRQQRRC